jgi:very-short-patch-repair endonuclease
MYRDLARDLRKNLTDAEQRLGGFKFRRQAPIGRFIADFVCFDRKVIVELDGGQHQLHVEEDRTRTEWLESQGFRMLRFWNHEVFEDLDRVLEGIWIALQGGQR